MSGRRIERVQRAAIKIIDHLSSQDILSVVAFNDHAEVIIPATMVTDKPGLKARVTMLKPFGGTDVRGLSAGIEQNRKFLAPRLVNHVIMLTDGNTYGDQDRCISLAQQVAQQGIGISALGLGDEWNDKFLDQIASVTGGSSSYIKSSSAVVSFLDQHVPASLSNVFAERLTLSVAPDIGVKLRSAFKLTPHAQTLPANEGVIPLGDLQINLVTSILLQFELPANMTEGYRSIARMVAAGDILVNDQRRYQALSDTSLGINGDPPKEDTLPAESLKPSVT